MKAATLALLVCVAGYAPIPMKYEDCKQQCQARGEDVEKYQMGMRFPIFKMHATVVCQCSTYAVQP